MGGDAALLGRFSNTRSTSVVRWLLYLLGISILSTLIFAIPVIAVDLTKTSKVTTASKANENDNMVPRSGMLIPLYIYPAPSAWDPLFTQ
jgi:hypothetical protein